MAPPASLPSPSSRVLGPRAPSWTDLTRSCWGCPTRTSTLSTTPRVRRRSPKSTATMTSRSTAADDPYAAMDVEQLELADELSDEADELADEGHAGDEEESEIEVSMPPPAPPEALRRSSEPAAVDEADGRRQSGEFEELDVDAVERNSLGDPSTRSLAPPPPPLRSSESAGRPRLELADAERARAGAASQPASPARLVGGLLRRRLPAHRASAHARADRASVRLHREAARAQARRHLARRGLWPRPARAGAGLARLPRGGSRSVAAHAVARVGRGAVALAAGQLPALRHAGDELRGSVRRGALSGHQPRLLRRRDQPHASSSACIARSSRAACCCSTW